MNAPTQTSRAGFSLIETVIAIGVLAVLLTGFMIVFAPAAAGIRKALNSQDAARLVTTLEEELVTLHTGQTYATGFDKAFAFIKGSGGASADEALLIYKYRASLTEELRTDGTREPVDVVDDQVPGVDYVVQSMMRRKGDAEFSNDLPAIEGQVYMVRCTQLITSVDPTDGKSKLILSGEDGKILNSLNPVVEAMTPDAYEHAVITFVADFYPCPGKTAGYFDGAFSDLFVTETKPMFSRNLAVRR